MSMNNASGLEIVAGGRYQHGPALSPMRVVGQKTMWAGGLSATSPSEPTEAPFSFQALLTAKEFFLPKLATNDPGADQVEANANRKRAGDKEPSKSNLTRSGTSGSRPQSKAKTPHSEATTATHYAELQPSTTPPSFLPAQPVAQVRMKTEAPEIHAEAAPAGSPVSRSKRRSNVSSEIGSKATDLQEASTSGKPAIPDGRNSLNSPAAEPSEGSRRSLRVATAESRRDTRLSSNTTAEALGGNGRSSPRIPTAVRDEGGGGSPVTTTAGPSSGRVSSATGSPNHSEVHFEENGLEAKAVSYFNREPAQELAVGLERGNSAFVSGKRSSQLTDRSTQNAPSPRTAPSGSGSAHKVMNPAAALPETVSSESVQSKRATVAAPQASKLFPPRPAPDKAISTVDQTTPVHPQINQAPHIHSGSQSSVTHPLTTLGFPREESSILTMNRATSVTPSDASSSRLGAVKPNAQDTFAALDGQNPSGAPVWIHTGGNTAEAGFKDPTLGWVGVRAQVDAGGVHVAVVPATADASQALSSNMTNLSAYLDEHHTPVQTLTMATPDSSWEGRNTDHSGSTNTGQGNAQENHSGQQQASGNSVAPAGTGAQDRFGQTHDPVESSSAYVATGAKYISVIA